VTVTLFWWLMQAPKVDFASRRSIRWTALDPSSIPTSIQAPFSVRFAVIATGRTGCLWRTTLDCQTSS
jgi:hypothetical protein